MPDYYLGADIGGTKTAAVLCDSTGAVVAHAWVEHDPEQPGTVSERILRALDQVSGGVAHAELRACGIAIAGLVSGDHRALVHGATLGRRRLPLADTLEPVLHCPCYIVNDANAALVGHLSESPEKVSRKHVILLTIGTGLGGAVTADGQILEGAHGYAAELGHLTVDFEDPRRCLCGAPGCVENYASGRGLAEMAAEAGLVSATEAASYSSRNVVELTATDPLAKAIVERAGMMLGRAMTQLSTALDPEEFIISGSVGHAAAGLLLPAARDEMERRWPFPTTRPIPEVRVDAIGPHAAAIGAARLARTNDESRAEHD